MSLPRGVHCTCSRNSTRNGVDDTSQGASFTSILINFSPIHTFLSFSSALSSWPPSALVTVLPHKATKMTNLHQFFNFDFEC